MMMKNEWRVALWVGGGSLSVIDALWVGGSASSSFYYADYDYYYDSPRNN